MVIFTVGSEPSGQWHPDSDGQVFYKCLTVDNYFSCKYLLINQLCGFYPLIVVQEVVGSSPIFHPED